MKNGPHGVLPAMITPLDEQGQICENGLRKMVDYVIEGGVHGVFAMGTTAEFYAVSDDEYRRAIEIVVNHTAGRVPVFAGANAITTRDCIKLVKIASKAGADAISVLTPMFISPSDDELYDHYRAIAESTDKDILLYNNSPKTHVNLKPALVERLSRIDNIVGIKDSAGDMTQLAEIIRMTEGTGFSALVGRDTLIYSNLCYGGAGAVAACANVAPRLCADIYDKFMAGDLKGSLESQKKLAPLRIAFGIGTFPAIIKEALNQIGIPVGKCFAPIKELTAEQKQQVRQVLTGMDLLDE